MVEVLRFDGARLEGDVDTEGSRSDAMEERDEEEKSDESLFLPLELDIRIPLYCVDVPFHGYSRYYQKERDTHAKVGFRLDFPLPPCSSIPAKPFTATSCEALLGGVECLELPLTLRDEGVESSLLRRDALRRNDITGGCCLCLWF